MKKIYLDCGAHEGVSLRCFRESYPDAAAFEVYAFEPNPDIGGCGAYCDHLIKAAVWIRDCSIPFYLPRHKKHSASSSLFKKKHTGGLDKKHPISVAAIDFSEWLTAHVPCESHVVVKMNIEGAEYPVLERLLDDGTIGMIGVLYVEWHAKKIGYPKQKHRELVRRLNDVSGLVLRPGNMISLARQGNL